MRKVRVVSFYLKRSGGEIVPEAFRCRRDRRRVAGEAKRPDDETRCAGSRLTVSSPRRSRSRKAKLLSGRKLNQVLLHRRPFRGDDRIANRIAGDEISRHPVRSEDPFEPASDALKRGPGTLIPGIRVEADTENLPDFEGMPQHEELSLSIRSGADC